METKSSSKNLGVGVSVRGSVVDMRFDEHLPPIYSVLRAGEEGASSLKCRRSVKRIMCAGLR
jgi:F-type H+-transporting ATPase subunit beta